jgi:hypothetical protein
MILGRAMVMQILAWNIWCICFAVACSDEDQCTRISSQVEASEEALSVFQVNAKRLERITATKQNASHTPMPQETHVVAVREHLSFNSSRPWTKASLLEVTNSKARALSVSRFKRGEEGSDTAIIIVLLVLAIAAICLLLVILQPPTPSRMTQQRGFVPNGYIQGASSRSQLFKPAPTLYADADQKTFLSLKASEMNSQTYLPSSAKLSTSQAQLSYPRSATRLGTDPSLSLTPILNAEREASIIQPMHKVQAQGMATSFPKRPPPLYPMMVLPHCESFFAVPIDQFAAGANSVEIHGLSGNALLRATLKDTSEGRVMEIAMSPQNSPPIASIREAAEEGPTAGMKEVKLCKPKPATHYGWLRPCDGGEILQCGGDDIMKIVIGRANSSCELYSCTTGDLLGQASRSCDGETMFNADDLEVRVAAGMDGVLVLLCVISMNVF